MMKTKWYIGALAALLVACKAPTLQEEAAGKYGKFTVNGTERAEIDSMVNGVAFQLLHKMHSNQENILVSPLGLCYALNMLNAGAEDMTQQQINHILGREGLADSLCRKMLLADAATVKSRSESPDDEVATLTSENKVAVGAGVNLLPAFEERMIRNYFAAIEAGDEAQKIILSNTLTFEGVWKEAFEPTETEPHSFTTEQGKVTKVPMMRGQFDLNYMETDDYQLVKIPYKGDFNLYVLLPKTGKKLASVVSDMNATVWQQAVKQMKKADVSLWFPKFSVAKKNGMKNVLKQLGMQNAFDSKRANLSNMVAERAYVDDVKQEVKIDFNEQRTHAEAKTTVEVAVLSAIDEPMKKEIEKRSVCCDHPFFYVVTNRFGAICFMGEVQQS
ncbi:serpin family protein [Segatella oris]|uniref:serpin family protein n=1 Tax=Segatella oris TaxID=28135 RepID=UPI00360C490B